MTPSGTRGVLNDAVSVYFPDPALAGTFVALVHRLQGRDRRRSAQGSRGRAGTKGRGWVTPETP
jgi:hypothetical protein